MGLRHTRGAEIKELIALALKSPLLPEQSDVRILVKCAIFHFSMLILLCSENNCGAAFEPEHSLLHWRDAQTTPRPCGKQPESRDRDFT